MKHCRVQSFVSRWLLLFTLCTSFFAIAMAQNATATLSGTVVDPNGALVSGVTVTATDPETRLQRITTTNDAGQFVIPLLPPNKYNLMLERQGFMIAEVRDLILNVNDNRSLTIKMKVGNVSETVNVTAESPLINDSPAVGTVVDRQFVENIPLNGRSFQSLITLTPGVVAAPADLTRGQFSVNGQRSDANTFSVDGVSANFGTAPNGQPGAQTSGSLPGLTTFGTTQSLASVDALQEFKVQTSSYAAEYGRTPGGQISIVTRSGTNQFHGSAFDYLRNDVLDANDWFANATGQRRAPERQNDFGGTFSGPVLLPGYNGHNRTFFFFSYEGLRLRLPRFALMNVPTLTLRQTAAVGLQPIMNAFPLPNGRDLGNGLAELNASYSDPSTLNAASIRIDHALNQKWNVFGRYNWAPSQSTNRNNSLSLSRQTANSITTQTLTVGVTTALTPRVYNELRVNFSDNGSSTKVTQDSFGGAAPPARSLLIPSQFDAPGAQGNLFLTFPGRTQPLQNPGVGVVNGGFVFDQRQFNLVDGVAYRRGSHQLKFGADYRRLTPLFVANAYSIVAIFSTQQQLINGVAAIGLVQAQTKASPIYVNFSAYGQDTWKVSRRLTLDLGIRWDVNPAPGEATGNIPLAVTEVGNLATMQLAPSGTKQWKTTYNNFAPRLGMAYQLREKSGRETIVRGGFGVFYDTGNNQASSAFNLSYPFFASRTVLGVAYPLSPTQVAPPVLPNVTNLTPPFGTAAIFDPKLKLPYTLQWNVAVEQSLGSNQVITLSYVGAAGRRLLQQRQLTLNAINPQFTTVKLTTNNATSDYHALQAQYQRRLSRGLQALASYTWSHAIDEDSADTGLFIVPVRGNADFDLRHVFAGALTYDIPMRSQERALKAVLGHWSIDTSMHAQSAFPVDLVGNRIVNPADGSLTGVRPNVNSGIPLYISNSSLPGGRRINPAAFAVAPAGQFGNLGRNVVRGLPAWQVDAALRRQFTLSERVHLQFRAEAFNIFNHPNFGTIQTTLTAPNFGQATNMLNQQLGGISPLYQIGGPRSFQFALKLLF